MADIGISESEVSQLVSEQLLAQGRYTLTQPGARPVFTKEQRDAIALAVSAAIKANNEAIMAKLREAGVSGL